MSGDITYLPTREGWLYLAVVIDLFFRQIVGWSMASHMRTQLMNNALWMAIWQRKPGKGCGGIRIGAVNMRLKATGRY